MSATVSSPFLSDSYTSDKDIIGNAITQQAIILSKKTKQPISVIEKQLQSYYSAHKEFFQSIKARALVKDKNEDREVRILPIASIFSFVKKKNYHFSPSMVAYKHSDEEESVNSIGTRMFIKNRSFYKGLRQEAKAAGDKELDDKYNKLQNAFKIFNNAQSGAMSSEGTPMNNMSGHTSLTSTCRSLTSTANLINEQFIAGNRFYHTPEVTLQSITARIQVTDFEELDKVVKKYNLYKPTPDDVMEIIERCSCRYWRSEHYLNIIRDLVNEFHELELCSIAYNLDLTTLYRYNESFMKEFFDEWTSLGTEKEEPTKPSNGDKYVLCISKLGRNPEQERIQKLNTYQDTVESKYSDFISIFFKSPIPPSDLFSVTSSIRDCVLTSDTDSSIYTVDKMMSDYTQDRLKGIRLSAVLTYFIRMVSVDQHKQLSMNMNVSLSNLEILNMKNEYFFGGYITTWMSKHYYASQRMVEGVMNEEAEMEIKGVHLRSSKISISIKEIAESLMKDAIFAIEDGRKLNASEQLLKVANHERRVMKEIDEGNFSWLSRQQVKGEASYSKPESSVYFYHELWEEVFSPKYGHAPDLPYNGTKINMDLESKTKLSNYIESIQDAGIRERFKTFIERTGRTKLGGLVVPQECLQSLGGIPEEIKFAIDYRSVIKQNFKSVYAVLESTGLYFMNEKITRLVSDEH